MATSMPETGERMIPEKTHSHVFWEHIYRYAFACQKVKDINVLDIASGEGYGTYALSKVAKSVIGVDISTEAVEHAKSKYNLDFRVGCADSIPIESSSLDAVVSFETIEHVPKPEFFVNEVFRVLKPTGLFIVSTPNKDVYHHDQRPNPFHCSELTKNELLQLLNPCFQVENLLGQVFPSGTLLDALQRIVGRLSSRLAFKLRYSIEGPLRKRFLPAIDTSDIGLRQRIIDEIACLTPPLNRMWNPYALRPPNDLLNNQPLYFVAVAKRRINRVDTH